MPQVSDVQHLVRNQIWDTNTLAWVVQTASTASGGGDASAANQVTGNASLASIDTKLSGPVDVSGSLVSASILTTPVGQQAMNNSMPVVLASNQSAIPVTGAFFQSTQPVSGSLGHLVASAATLTNVSSSATSVQLLASTAGRRLATVFNDSTAILFLKYGTTASATSYTVKIPAGGYFEFPHPVYTGRVDGIWDAANGAARITETT